MFDSFLFVFVCGIISIVFSLVHLFAFLGRHKKIIKTFQKEREEKEQRMGKIPKFKVGKLYRLKITHDTILDGRFMCLEKAKENDCLLFSYPTWAIKFLSPQGKEETYYFYRRSCDGREGMFMRSDIFTYAQNIMNKNI